MITVQQLIAELERLTKLEGGLSYTRAFVLTVRVGVDHRMQHGQPPVAALWPQDKLQSESEEGDMVDRSAIVKELTAAGKFLRSDKLSGSRGLLWGAAPIRPTMLATYLGGVSGGMALGAMGAFGGGSTFRGFGGSTIWAGGGPQFAQGTRIRGKGGRGVKQAKCNKCGTTGKTGQAIMHSFRNCPLTTCHKCGQNGHIERDCQT